jgi:aminoglycoside phosphotransferase (APT) family kinase protein
VLAHADSTPLLLSHRDSDMKNVLRTRDDELLLVDWDQAGPVSPRHDLANHALVWAGVHLGDPDPAGARAVVDAYRRAAGTSERFRPTDLAELVALRLGWFDFNVRRALGERARDDADRQAGVRVIRQNVAQLPRFARSLDDWLAVLGD